MAAKRFKDIRAVASECPVTHCQKPDDVGRYKGYEVKRSTTALNEFVVMLVHPLKCLSSAADETLGRHRPHTTVVRFKGTTALIRLVQDKAIQALRSRRNRAHGDECKKGSHNMAA